MYVPPRGPLRAVLAALQEQDALVHPSRDGHVDPLLATRNPGEARWVAANRDERVSNGGGGHRAGGESGTAPSKARRSLRPLR